MNNIEIPDRSTFLEIASHWDELDQLQIIKILKLAGKFAEGTMNYDKFIVQAFYVIARVQRNWISVFRERRLSKQKRLEKFANIYLVAEELTQFLFLDKSEADGPKTVEINYCTVRNYFPTIKTSSAEFFGPADLLQDLTFGEFRTALDAMHQYFSTKVDEDLNYFISCLYRPASRNSPIIKREKLNEELQGIYAQELNSVPKHIRTGIMLWFAYCVKYLQSEAVTINNRIIDLPILFPKPKKDAKTNAGIGWTGILYSIAKEGVFGPVDQVDQKGLFDVLLFMYDNYLQNEKIKRNAKK